MLGGARGSVEMARLPDSKVQLFDESFALKDPSGAALANMPTKVTAPDGVVIAQTAEDGKTNKVATVAAEKLKYELQWQKIDP